MQNVPVSRQPYPGVVTSVTTHIDREMENDAYLISF
jgi:hypothetical protein